MTTLYNEDIDIYDIKHAMEEGKFIMIIEDRRVSLIDEVGNSVTLGTIITTVSYN